MKLTKYLAGFSALAFASAAYADVDVTITGATAFRAATLSAIKAKYDAASTVSYKYAHDGAATKLTGATRAIFIGSFPGVTGTTTIRCCFTGSVEGVRALVPVTDPSPPTYYQSSLLDTKTAGSPGVELALALSSTQIADVTNNGAAALGTQSDLAFSDVSKSSTPYAAYNLLPASPNAGVIVFTMVANKGTTGITNVTSQQFRALLTKGRQPRSMFTGVATDTDLVFATGRNDGSGTRTTYLAETGYGIVKTVKQYVVNTSDSGTGAVTQIQLVPAGGVNSPALTGQSASNASTVWGQDVDGNGGYNSGSTLKGDLQKTTGAVTVLDETGTDAFGSTKSCSLVTWLSVSDAAGAKAGNAIICGYNGEILTDLAGGASVMSSDDIAKITSGKYSAWGYERMYRRNDITSGDKVTVDAAIRAAIPALVTSSGTGVALTAMKVNRPSDGGLVAP